MKNLTKFVVVASLSVLSVQQAFAVGGATSKLAEASAARIAPEVLAMFEAALSARTPTGTQVAVRTLAGKLGIRQGMSKSDIEGVLARAQSANGRSGSLFDDLAKVAGTAKQNPNHSYVSLLKDINTQPALSAAVGASLAKDPLAGVLSNPSMVQGIANEVRMCSLVQVPGKVADYINQKSACAKELQGAPLQNLIKLVQNALQVSNDPRKMAEAMVNEAVKMGIMDVNRDGQTSPEEARQGLQQIAGKCDLLTGKLKEAAVAL